MAVTFRACARNCSQSHLTLPSSPRYISAWGSDKLSDLLKVMDRAELGFHKSDSPLLQATLETPSPLHLLGRTLRSDSGVPAWSGQEDGFLPEGPQQVNNQCQLSGGHTDPPFRAYPVTQRLNANMQDLFLNFHDVWGQPGWKFQAQEAHVMTTLHPLPLPQQEVCGMDGRAEALQKRNTTAQKPQSGAAVTLT